MSSCLSIFSVVEALELRTVPYNTGCCFNDVITQVTVSGLEHLPVFCIKLAGLVPFPHDPAVLSESVIVLKHLDGADLGKDAGGKDFANPRDRIKDRVLRWIKTLNSFKDRSIYGFQLFFKGLDAVK